MRYEGNEFSTSDLYFAAYLLVAGVRMLRTDRSHGTKFLFVFDTSVSNIEELKNAWFTQVGKVSALAYANQIKTFKSAVHMS
jgi:hypothetical protein